MVARHGRVARTPVSSRDLVLPGQLAVSDQVTRNPPAQAGASRETLEQQAAALLDQPTYLQRSRSKLGLARVLDWLETFPGEDWQDRWLLSGSDALGRSWGPPQVTPAQRAQLTGGLRTLIVLLAVRPSYAWLSGTRQLGIYEAFRARHQQQAFAELQAQIAARCRGSQEYAAEAINLLTRLVIVTGKDLRELEMADLGEYAAARRASGRTSCSLTMAYQALHAIGGLAGQPPTLRQATARGQLSVPELVDRYPVASAAMREVLVHYLLERSAMLDYGSLDNLAQVLVNLFWVDLERHHPGISSLHLPDTVKTAWKQRIRTLPDGNPRHGVHTVLLQVRAFYLDLLQWSLADPARWAAWAAPCPVSEHDVAGYVKENRRRQARMQERTRTLAPVLPRLVATAERRLDDARGVLAIVGGLRPGDEFTVGDRRYRRSGRGGSKWRPSALFVTPADPAGPRFDAEIAEDNAFWAWAIVEVLRRTGCRIEEMLELTHLSVRQYLAPTGETIPLLQISPSKTDRERVIPATPELVSVLARIIRRIKADQARVPLLSRYDSYERVFGPPLPYLFQRVSSQQLQVIPPQHVRDLLDRLAGAAGAADVDGTPIRFTPHDFRRIFSTETVNSGLPIHIAAKLLGHLDLNTTQGYVAVYPEEVIRHYRQFVASRRESRPSEEYREPTGLEWAEFRDHFSLRKVALGTCDRPYGTPCQHEAACVRCPMLRLAPAQIPRLLEIETNHRERLDEAHRMQWLGEVAALEEGLSHIAAKKQQAEQRQASAQHGDDASALG